MSARDPRPRFDKNGRPLTAAEAAELLGMSARNVRRLRAEPRSAVIEREAARRERAAALRAEGKSYREIADEMGVSTGTVGHLLHEHRKQSEAPRKCSSSPLQTVYGDDALAAQVLELLPTRGVHALGIASVTRSGSRIATVGAPLAATFEIGSINKGITGMLYLDAIEREEVLPTTTLGELFELQGFGAAGITLEELSQHRSGLPAQPMGMTDIARIIIRTIQARNPFDGRTLVHLVEDLRRVPIGAKEPAYSNLGFAALGHALAAAAGMDYAELLRERIARPLELGRFYIPAEGQAALDEQAVQGKDKNGRPQQAWTDLQYAPAGGIRTDVKSMAKVARALLTGLAPGAAALNPVAAFSTDGADRVGAGWMTSRIEGQTITWHNGRTGGFSSWIGFDREQDHALFLVGATTLALDEIGETLLLSS